MLKMIGKRLLLLIPILFGVSLLVFSLLYITPGDPAQIILGNSATPDAVQNLRAEMGLDKPYLYRFGKYLFDFVIKGDLGQSFTTKQPVTTLLGDAFPNTLKLAVAGTLISVILGLFFGIVSAVKQYTWLDNISMSIALVGISIPAFWLAMLFILVFSVWLGWLPSSGFSSFKHLIMPAFAMGTMSAGSIARMTRSSMLEVIRQDYIVTARSKGQKESVVILRHALKNALIPILTVIGICFGEMLGGSIVIEAIFSIPGIGSLMVNAIKARNYLVVQGGVLYVALAFTLVNLAVDILYMYVDPRLKSKSR